MIYPYTLEELYQAHEYSYRELQKRFRKKGKHRRKSLDRQAHRKQTVYAIDDRGISYTVDVFSNTIHGSKKDAKMVTLNNALFIQHVLANKPTPVKIEIQ